MKVPYECHVLVCVNDRQGRRKSCADGENVKLRERLKQMVAERGWRGRVRVSQTGCLGLCEQGPNVILYPQGRLYAGVSLADADRIERYIAELIGEKR